MTPLEQRLNALTRDVRRLSNGLLLGGSTIPSPTHRRPNAPVYVPAQRGLIPTVFIASGEASDDQKRAAGDFVCDFTASDIDVFQAAVDLCNDLDAGTGLIELSNGEFDLSGGPVVNPNAAGELWVRGQGENRTVLEGDFGGGPSYLWEFTGGDRDGMDGMKFSDMSIVGCGHVFKLDIISNSFVLENVHVDTADSVIDGVAPTGGGDNLIVYYLRVKSCRFFDCGQSAPVLDLKRRLFKAIITGTIYDGNCGTNISSTIAPVTDLTEQLIIANNVFDNGVTVTGAREAAITGNTAEAGDLTVEDLTNSIIIGNVFDNYVDNGGHTGLTVPAGTNRGTGFP